MATAVTDQVASWTHEWDPATGELRLLRDGHCYSSLVRGILIPSTDTTATDRARKAVRYLFDLCGGLLQEDHGWGENDAEATAIVAMSSRALSNILASMMDGVQL